MLTPIATKDFDFLHGSWRVHHRYLKGRLQGSSEWVEFEGQSETQPLLNGSGNVERCRFVREGKEIEGAAFRLFNPATGQWSIYWADTVNPGILQPPVLGRFQGDFGEFTGDDELNGRKILCRFRWTRIGTGAPLWEQAFSADGGTSWETNWIMTFTKEEKK